MPSLLEFWKEFSRSKSGLTGLVILLFFVGFLSDFLYCAFTGAVAKGQAAKATSYSVAMEGLKLATADGVKPLTAAGLNLSISLAPNLAASAGVIAAVVSAAVTAVFCSAEKLALMAARCSVLKAPSALLGKAAICDAVSAPNWATLMLAS